jgi:hypothetical protein
MMGSPILTLIWRVSAFRIAFRFKIHMKLNRAVHAEMSGNRGEQEPTPETVQSVGFSFARAISCDHALVAVST